MRFLTVIFLFLFSINCYAKELKVLSAYTPFAGSVLYYPNDGKSHPGVIVLHGSEGGSLPFSRLIAQMLAAHGYAALAFCWYNCLKDPILEPFERLENVDLNKTYEAFLWLKQSKYVQNKKTAIYGVSRGAEQALILGWKTASENLVLPDSIAAHAPSDTVVGGFNWSTLDRRCWLCATFDFKCFRGSDNPQNWDWVNVRWNPACGRSPKNPLDMTAWLWKNNGLKHGTRIEIELFKNSIFITHGTEDELWEHERALRIKKTLEEAGLTPEVHLFKGEKHVFQLPAENRKNELLLNFFKRTLQ